MNTSNNIQNPYKIVNNIEMKTDIESILINKDIKYNIINKLKNKYEKKIYNKTYINEVINVQDDNYRNEIRIENKNGEVYYILKMQCEIFEIATNMILIGKIDKKKITKNEIYINHGALIGIAIIDDTNLVSIKMKKNINNMEYVKIKIMNNSYSENKIIAIVQIIEEANEKEILKYFENTNNKKYDTK